MIMRRGSKSVFLHLGVIFSFDLLLADGGRMDETA